MATTSKESSLDSLKTQTSPERAYDSEIADMSSYIHHYKVDSKLAVSEDSN